MGLENLCHQLLQTCVKLLELRNPYNINHCQLVASHCDRLARHLNLAAPNRHRLVRAAEIHTLGVLLQMEEKQPERSLPLSRLAPGQTGREVSIQEREIQIFAGLLSDLPEMDGCLEILQQRHHWFDGSTAPTHGLCLEARLLAVVDAYVDLVTPKAHRPPEDQSTALQRINEMTGTQFDPQMVTALTEMLQAEGQAKLAEPGQFQRAHCRHYLSLGHFYTQIHEREWALRCYLAAERMASRNEDSGLELAAISGQFMVFCEGREFDRARELLQEFRKRSSTQRDRLGFQLLWGLLEWLQGSPLGKDILAEFIRKQAEQENYPGWAAALGFQACMTLFHQGQQDPEHLELLREFLSLVGSKDVFDVVERYRPYTIPVLLNAIVQRIEAPLARNLLTRMGEPCHGPVHERLKSLRPSDWSKALLAQPVLEAPSCQGPGKEILQIETLGGLRLRLGERTLGMEAWPTLKTVKLFLRLALQPDGIGIPGDRLAEELWPESGIKNGRDSLRNGLAQVRKTLRTFLRDDQSEIILRNRKEDIVSLQLDYLFDFDGVNQGFDQAQREFAQSNYSGAIQMTEKVEALFRGDFLESFDDDWVVATRSRLSAVRIQNQTLMARCFLLQDDYLQLENCARGLLQVDDLREETHCLLLQALAGQGRSVEAIAHFEAANEMFDNEIGVEPIRLRQTLKELGLLL